MVCRLFNIKPLPEDVVWRNNSLLSKGPLVITLIEIDQSHISHNVFDKYPTVHHFARFCYKVLHCGIWYWCIVGLRIWSVRVKIQPFACNKMNFERLYAKWRPFVLGISVLTKIRINWFFNNLWTNIHWLRRLQTPQTTLTNTLLYTPIKRTLNTEPETKGTPRTRKRLIPSSRLLQG